MAPAIGDRTLFRRLLRLARPCAPQLAALLALDLFDGVWVLLTPLPLKIAIDSVLGARPLPGPLADLVPASVTESPTTLLSLAVGMLLVITLLNNLQTLAATLLRGHVGERLVLGFRSAL